MISDGKAVSKGDTPIYGGLAEKQLLSFLIRARCHSLAGPKSRSIYPLPDAGIAAGQSSV